MEKKKIKVLVFVLIILSALAVCYVFWLGEDEWQLPKVPEKSSKGKIILASEGCCYWAEDVTVYILTEDGNKTVLISEKTVYEYDIFECKNIPKIETPIMIGIDFISYYPDPKPVSLIIGEFLSTAEMLEKGLLLCFGDGDLRVHNGNNEKFFRDGVFHGFGDGEWYQEVSRTSIFY